MSDTVGFDNFAEIGFAVLHEEVIGFFVLDCVD